MISKVFTVYDGKAEAYLPSFNFNTIGQALRALADTVQQPDHPFAQHPEDYTIFEIATWDDSTGIFLMHESKIALGNALELKSGDVPPIGKTEGTKRANNRVPNTPVAKANGQMA